MATVLVTEDGRVVLERFGVTLPDNNLLLAFIQESEDLGLWLRLSREDQIHFFLLMWHHVQDIDLASGLGKSMGFKG
jgi:hypothetical protein